MAATKYELAAKHPDGRKFLLAYSERKTLSCLYSSIRGNAAALVAAGFPEDAKITASGCKPYIRVEAGGWEFLYTGYTALDVKIRGELPSINA